jgi:hypothetical protein
VPLRRTAGREWGMAVCVCVCVWVGGRVRESVRVKGHGIECMGMHWMYGDVSEGVRVWVVVPYY